MPAYTPEQIYRAARALLPALDEAIRQQVEALLAQAERGADTHLRLLDLLTQDKATRERVRDLLKGEADGERLLGGYDALGGEPESTRPGAVYVCPVPGCDYRYLIGEAGETPPPCPRHRQPLIPAQEKEE